MRFQNFRESMGRARPYVRLFDGDSHMQSAHKCANLQLADAKSIGHNGTVGFGKLFFSKFMSCLHFEQANWLFYILRPRIFPRPVSLYYIDDTLVEPDYEDEWRAMMKSCGVELNLTKRLAGTSLIFLGVHFDFEGRTARISNSTFVKMLNTVGYRTEHGYYMDIQNLQALCSRIEYLSFLHPLGRFNLYFLVEALAVAQRENKYAIALGPEAQAELAFWQREGDRPRSFDSVSYRS